MEGCEGKGDAFSAEDAVPKKDVEVWKNVFLDL